MLPYDQANVNLMPIIIIKNGFDRSIKNVNIEDGTWISAKAIVCFGVFVKTILY